MSLILRRCLGGLAALVLLAGVAFAQSEDLDYGAWDEVATRAEQVLGDNDATDSALEGLRQSVVDWRERFLSGQGINAPRIDTLQAQIDALGPVPAEGETEPEDIATRRENLNAQLAELQAPGLRAQEAYTRADGIIRQIDTMIRTRQTDALLTLGPTPLNPQLWPAALEEVLSAGSSLFDEIRRDLASEVKLAEARESLPLILLLLALAGLLVIRGPRVMRGFGERLRASTRRGTGVWRFFVSLGGILVPLAGVMLLVAAVQTSDLPGTQGSELLQMLPAWTFLLLYIRWLAEQSFNRDPEVATVPLADRQRTEAWLYASVLAVLFVLRDVGETLGELYNFTTATMAVLDFPVLLLCALMLFRLGHILTLLREPQAEGEETPPPSLRQQVARLLGRAAMLLALAGPVMAAIGYNAVGDAMVYPAIQTLALLALVLVLQRFVNDVYTLVSGKRAEDSDSLVPVLAGFALMLLALPGLALIWGARTADLLEIWTRFREGFVLGDTRISPTSFLTMVAVFGVGFLATRLLQGGLRSSVLPRTRLDLGGQNAVVSGLGYVGIFIAAVIAITAAGIDLSSLAIVAGALSVGIGFGLQNIVSNFVSGIILLIERPISQGDWIEVGGNMGIVKDISVRSTRIETFDRTDVIVPNSDFVSGTVTNYTRGNVVGRVFATVGVAYGTDTRKVEQILRRIAREHDMVLMNPEPSVVLARFGPDGLEFEIRAIIRDVGEKLNVLSDFNHMIAQRFTEEGIEIPFAQRDIWLRNPETLYDRARATPPAPATQDPEPTAAAATAPQGSGRDPSAGISETHFVGPEDGGDGR
ncbi:DUF3772 domain-containing protein [Salipiger marinus]|uniref:DUF3772 domain-containing protein n=1 Tax=Salipiger marinus TaxID=555512 RepID=UPI002BAE9828|nr:DUF3772 domain-containing protein [Salipiger manganoxidans]MEB3418873.1 DUF3772 domain-containing protein [Salipiger manganoxidans]